MLPASRNYRPDQANRAQPSFDKSHKRNTGRIVIYLIPVYSPRRDGFEKSAFIEAHVVDSQFQ